LDDSNSELQCFIHYLGWNSRFDDWIGKDAIVGFADATPARVGRTPKTLGKVEKFMDFIVCW